MNKRLGCDSKETFASGVSAPAPELQDREAEEPRGFSSDLDRVDALPVTSWCRLRGYL